MLRFLPPSRQTLCEIEEFVIPIDSEFKETTNVEGLIRSLLKFAVEIVVDNSLGPLVTELRNFKTYASGYDGL